MKRERSRIASHLISSAQVDPWRVLVMLLLTGCSASTEIRFHLLDGTTRSRPSFTLTGSSVVFPPVWTRVNVAGGSYQQRFDTTFKISEVERATIVVPDASSTARFFGGAAGFALGAFLGSSQGLGPRGGYLDFTPVATGTAAAIIGGCLGPYVIDLLSLRSITLDLAVESQRDSLRLFAERAHQ